MIVPNRATQLESWLSFVLEVHEIWRKHAPKDRRSELLRQLPYCAAHGFLFAGIRGGRVVAASVAGPVLPETLERHGNAIEPELFNKDGAILYCSWNLVLPRYRGAEGRALMAEMLEAAQALYPEATHLAYGRGHRGDERVRLREFRKPEAFAPIGAGAEGEDDEQ